MKRFITILMVTMLMAVCCVACKGKSTTETVNRKVTLTKTYGSVIMTLSYDTEKAELVINYDNKNDLIIYQNQIINTSEDFGEEWGNYIVAQGKNPIDFKQSEEKIGDGNITTKFVAIYE